MATLADLKRHVQEQKEREEARLEAQNRFKANWLGKEQFKGTDSIVVRFLNELADEDSNAEGPIDGLGDIEIAVEHVSPHNFGRRAKCSIESGQCLGCELNKSEPDEEVRKLWRQRTNLYVWVLYNGKPYVFSRNANAAFTTQLIDEAVDEGDLTGRNYRLTKSGAGTTTNYTIKGLKGDPAPIPDDIEIVPLSVAAIRDVPYEDQARFYAVPTQEDSSAVQSEQKSDEPDNDLW